MVENYLVEQVRAKGLAGFEEIVVVAGRKYVEVVAVPGPCAARRRRRDGVDASGAGGGVGTALRLPSGTIPVNAIE